MKVEQMSAAITSQSHEIDKQQLYIVQLEQLQESGQELISVYDAKFSRNTSMEMSDFIDLQQAILDKMVPSYAALLALYDKFQKELDALVNEDESQTVSTF
ncbi:hypothetical protein HOT32_gp18 [Erwinia phage Faunus]|uniref:Uncharacterized protein n=1 Tax=Erwinia phage Faunus TaxID=2182346 RepID=A0A2U8UWH4_9CAUD|nr:hypothetical protein HOT32_gp18 [Erwinia phage Faunus]AWN08601.1 hypothetical protein [Erwinia phage Faunus]